MQFDRFQTTTGNNAGGRLPLASRSIFRALVCFAVFTVIMMMMIVITIIYYYHTVVVGFSICIFETPDSHSPPLR